MRHSVVQSILLASLVLAACSEPLSTTVSTDGLRAPATRPASVNVTSIVYDADSAGTPLYTRSDDYNGAGSAIYTAGNNVTSHITSDGAWQLYLGNQTVRRLYLVLASQGIPVPDGYYSKNVEAFAKCYDQNNVQVSLLSMAAGTVNGNCSFGVDFANGKTKYKLVMGPPYAGTGRALVTCNNAVNGACTTWTIMPNPDVANPGVANLYHFDNRGRLVFDGVYRNSYSVMLSR